MIGVAVQPQERDSAKEFFELCKTPWEFVQSDRQYDVVISTSDTFVSDRFRFVLLFSGANTEVDLGTRNPVRIRPEGAVLAHAGQRFPIYGPAATFPASPIDLIQEEITQEPALYIRRNSGMTVARIGYNLFEEVRLLLTDGQPTKYAGIATLELHIALLRDLVTRAGLPFVEIPPVPDGYAFIACLTHDVDHPILRNHRFDHTMFGFLYRATIGSLIDTARGRRPVRNLCRNWAAAAKLPLLHLGLAKDSWSDFDRYLEIESGARSTFFVIPKNGYPGRKVDGPAPAKRACRYTLAQLEPQLKRIKAAGSEVALHGLDAWLDPDQARDEREQVLHAIGPTELGVRMHWLYFDRNSPAILDQAGFSYDSTVGYNQTIGFRVGTTQAYRPIGAVTLLEVPLNIMDTALFYPDYLDLGDKDALRIIDGLVENVSRFGGVLTFNWHDRSIAPERMWDEFYRETLRKLVKKGAWCPTMSTAVAWFRKRRAASVNFIQLDSNTINVRGCVNELGVGPGLIIRVHKPRPPSPAEFLAERPRAATLDLRLINDTESRITIST